jgi:hypothetical protein
VIALPICAAQIAVVKRLLNAPSFMLAGVFGRSPSDETANVHCEKTEIRDDHGVTMSPQPNYTPKEIAKHHHREPHSTFVT